ncbi:MAG: hypothetical protein IKA09_13405 [Lachnospiraceae bacterium]|nr:hypothetical protein [Lachnospiraceae bacterium]
MGKKIKEYFKGKNPYLMASAAIVIVSMMVICMILKSAVQETDAVDVVSEVVIEVQESEPSEFVQDSEVVSQEPDSEPVSMVETKILPTEQVQSTPEPQGTPVTETTPIPEAVITPEPKKVIEPEEIVPPEVVPDTQPEDAVPQGPGTEVTDETVAEAEPKPEETPLPEVTPAPEEIPEPEASHEHSWMFESVFQEPTCSNGGLENQTCAHCGETRTVGGTPTGEHDYVVENVGDCCSEEIVRCSECNTRDVREKDMRNHIDVEDGICYGCGQKVASE